MSGMIAGYEFPKSPLLCKAEEKELAQRIAGGDRAARDRMIEVNIPLVISVAQKMLRPDLQLEDLIQEGNIGLMRAAEKFDGSKGYKFSTYATWWIRQAIGRYIGEQRLIRLPVYVADALTLLRKETTRLEMILEREPTTEELAHTTGFTVERIHVLQELPRTFSFNKSMRDQDPYANEPPEAYEIFLQDPCDLENDYIESMQEERVLLQHALSTLSERSRDIIQRRYGIGCDKSQSLEQIARVYGLSRERVRQLEVMAMNKLMTALSEQGVTV